MEKPTPGKVANDLILPGLLGLAWISVVVLFNPIGDFPLNDDWAFGSPVEALLKYRTLRFTDWQAPTLVAQVLWGALFCLPAGFSFTALRLSTLTLGLVGLVGMYYLLRQLGADRRYALLGAGALGFNPFYLLLAASFMTDIPYLALTIVSLTLLLRGVDEGPTTTLVCGLALACLSIFIRQIGLLTLIGFMVAYPIRRGFGKRWLLLAFFPSVLSAGLLWLYERFLRSIGELPGLYSSKSIEIKMFVLDLVHLHLGAMRWPARSTIVLGLYLGMWALPCTLWLVPEVNGLLAPARRKATWLWLAVVTAGVTALLTIIGWVMPMAPNQLNNFGMGVVTLPGEPPGLPRPFWILITAIAVAGGALMILTSGALVRERWRTRGAAFTHESWPWQVVFFVVVGALTFGPIACSYDAVFDRYFLTFVPLLFGSIVALSRGVTTVSNPMFRRLSVLAMAIYLAFGVTATHDYLEWNRALWAMAAELHESSNVPQDAIDGGSQYNNLLDTRRRFETKWIHQPNVVDLVKNPLRPYCLAFEPLASYEVVGCKDCRSWLPQGVRQVYALHRLPGGSSKASPEAGAKK